MKKRILKRYIVRLNKDIVSGDKSSKETIYRKGRKLMTLSASDFDWWISTLEREKIDAHFLSDNKTEISFKDLEIEEEIEETTITRQIWKKQSST